MLDRLRAAVAVARESFGPDDRRTLAARLALSNGYREHSREQPHDELVALADDCARILGPEHPDTLTARLEAGRSCLRLFMVQGDRDRLPEAVRRLAEVAADRERLCGSAHPDTLDVWSTLSFTYRTAQRVAESKALDERILAGWQQVLADRERELGPDVPDTQFARLRVAERSDPHVAKALNAMVETSWGRLAAERNATLGPTHPDTIYAREHHAYGHGRLGRIDDQIRIEQEIAADLLDALGPSDPRTLRAQVQLMVTYTGGDRDPDAAIDLGERILDDVGRIAGPEHPELRPVRTLLISAYHSRGRTNEANALLAHYPVPDDDDDL